MDYGGCKVKIYIWHKKDRLWITKIYKNPTDKKKLKDSDDQRKMCINIQRKLMKKRKNTLLRIVPHNQYFLDRTQYKTLNLFIM